MGVCNGMHLHKLGMTAKIVQDNRDEEPVPSTKVMFIPDNVEIRASPGESLSEVARRAGVEIIESCGVGDCGTCEVMMVEQVTGDRIYIKSCVTKIPKDNKKLIIDTVGDSIPPW